MKSEKGDDMIKGFVQAVKNDVLEDEEKLWIIFKDRQLLLNSEKENLPGEKEVSGLEFDRSKALYLGRLNQVPVMTAVVSDDFLEKSPLVFMSTFEIFQVIGHDYFSIISYANHYAHWDMSVRFCGTCGSPTVRSDAERMIVCSSCGVTSYPKISPAVAVGVIKGEEILLARAHNFPDNFFSIVAGYTEPGESLEECLQREVMEETGIKVKNITYFGSQPWGLSGSLMVGYTAEYESGEIVVDENEIAEAHWFSPDSLPNLPPGYSLSRQIIDWCVEQQMSNKAN